MKKRPSIALAMIVKNEAHNLGPLLSSIKDCFDEIYVTDTGSTDNTVEILNSEKATELAGCPIHVSHFPWVNDFAKARNFNFDQVSKEIDYIFWQDGDDVLSDREKFIHFRDHTMHCAHQWLVPYNYAFNDKGEPICTFVRERIVKNNYGFKWRFFVHEGLINSPDKKVRTQLINSFTVNHMRTKEDEKQDKLRNLTLFKDREKDLCIRMKYYWGKELFEAREFLSSIKVLSEICKNDSPEFQLHDRVMAMQYLSGAYAECGDFDKSLNIALQGLHLCPERAEFWVLCGDANIRLNRVHQAALFYEAAKKCPASNLMGFTYTCPHSYREYPSQQLAQIYINTGQIEKARAEVELLRELKHPELKKFEDALVQLTQMSVVPEEKDLAEVDDIVITCPPGGVTSNWDENVLAEKGLGGSETACVEIARQLKLKTGSNVKVFQQRDKSEVMPSGVEYLPVDKLQHYFMRYKPKRHLAWRHATRLTPAKSYLFQHDLITPGAEFYQNYDKALCLTEFHKRFEMDLQGVPEDKIALVSNGIDSDMISSLRDVKKIPGKIMFPSSPDRELDRTIEIVKRVKEKVPEVKLHVFYGTGNMRKMGLEQEADRLDKLMKDNSDFVEYHGFVSKAELMRHWAEACVWIYPALFVETFAITALEAVASRCYPIVSDMGALRYTLKEAIDKDMCSIIDPNAESDVWADEAVRVLNNKLWEKVDIDPHNYSWEKAADKFVQVMEL